MSHRLFQTRRRRGYTLLEVALASFMMGWAMLIFSGLYPTASTSSQMSGQYAQAISAVQHKVDELRSLGYGRLTYAQLRSAGVIDATPAVPPYRFEATDQLSGVLSNPVGTITFTQIGTDLVQAKVHLDWRRVPYKGTVSTHEITILIANE